MEKEKKEIGIILTGSKTWKIPENLLEDAVKKVIDRELEKNSEINFVFLFDSSLGDSDLLLHVHRFIGEKDKDLAKGSESKDSRFRLFPVVANWDKYKKQAGWRRNKKMCELGNYCLSFTESPQEIKTGPIRFLLDMAREEKLIVREIYPKTENNEENYSSRKKLLGK